jgi:predicted nucleic acid binding AN1-type Zn finger protein
MESPSSTSNGRPDRTLRIVTIVAIIPALALLIPSGVVTAKPLPAIGLVPMAMSAVVSMAALASKKSSTRVRPTADVIVATSLMIVMVFRLVHCLSRKD